MGKSVVLGLSGGMDSATLCGFYLERGYNIIPVSFSYGSKHARWEQLAAQQISAYYHLHLEYVQLPFVNALFKSNLLQSGGDIPEGHYQEETMTQTVVPARNIIFISIMAGIAWSKEATTVALAVHAGDHAIYPDCRRSFLTEMTKAILEGTDGRVVLEAPFITWDKQQILTNGYAQKIIVPYALTRTCYKDQQFSCGKCGACVERLEAFQKLNILDPINYQR